MKDRIRRLSIINKKKSESRLKIKKGKDEMPCCKK